MPSRFVALIVLVISLCAASAFAASVVPLPTLVGLAGAWLGSSEGHGEYFRLEIDQTGQGILTVQSLSSEKADAYRIVSTSLSNGVVAFKLIPSGSAEAIYLRGSATLAGMELDAGNVAHRWHRKVFLEQESEVLSRIEAVRKRAQEFRTATAPMK
jgi:hypothetical protein